MILTSCNVVPTGQGATESISAGVIFHWHREGGIAGFCDDITISSTEEATVSSCQTNPSETVAELELTEEEQAALTGWLDTYATDTYEMSDPATADALTIEIEFYGVGETVPDQAAWQQMDRFAQQLLGRSRP